MLPTTKNELEGSRRFLFLIHRYFAHNGDGSDDGPLKRHLRDLAEAREQEENEPCRQRVEQHFDKVVDLIHNVEYRIASALTTRLVLRFTQLFQPQPSALPTRASGERLRPVASSAKPQNGSPSTTDRQQQSSSTNTHVIGSDLPKAAQHRQPNPPNSQTGSTSAGVQNEEVHQIAEHCKEALEDMPKLDREYAVKLARRVAQRLSEIVADKQSRVRTPSSDKPSQSATPSAGPQSGSSNTANSQHYSTSSDASIVVGGPPKTAQKGESHPPDSHIRSASVLPRAVQVAVPSSPIVPQSSLNDIPTSPELQQPTHLPSATGHESQDITSGPQRTQMHHLDTALDNPPDTSPSNQRSSTGSSRLPPLRSALSHITPASPVSRETSFAQTAQASSSTNEQPMELAYAISTPPEGIVRNELHLAGPSISRKGSQQVHPTISLRAGAARARLNAAELDPDRIDCSICWELLHDTPQAEVECHQCKKRQHKECWLRNESQRCPFCNVHWDGIEIPFVADD